MHGGGAKQVREKARERLLAAADVAAAHLIKFMKDERVPYPVRLSAARDLLDRVDLVGRNVVEVQLTKFEAMLDKVIVWDDDEAGDDGPAAQTLDLYDEQAIEGEVLGSRIHEQYVANDADDADLEDVVLPSEPKPDALPASPPGPPTEAASLTDVPPKRTLDRMSAAERRAAVRSSVRDTSPAPRAARSAKLRGRSR
jgi:hypothetical protein